METGLAVRGNLRCVTDANADASLQLTLALQKLHEDRAWLRPLLLQQPRVKRDALVLPRVQPLTQICRLVGAGGCPQSDLQQPLSPPLSLYITCSLALRGCVQQLHNVSSNVRLV